MIVKVLVLGAILLTQVGEVQEQVPTLTEVNKTPPGGIETDADVCNTILNEDIKQWCLENIGK